MTTQTLDDLAGRANIDSRALYDRLNELADMETFAEDEPELIDDDERAELVELRALQEETEGYAGDNWRDGVTFIRESDFENYARELADEIGPIDRDVSWPFTHIDWEAAAEALKMDYTEVEIRGISYLFR